MNKAISSLLLSVGILLVSSHPVQADPITRIEGAYSSVSGPLTQFDAGNFTLINGTAAFQPGAIGGFSASDLDVIITNFTTTESRVDFGSSVLTIATAGMPSEAAVFNITSPGQIVSNNNTAATPTTTLSTTVSLVSNAIPTLDLSSFTSGVLQIIVTDVEVTPGGAADPTEDGPFLPDSSHGTADILNANAVRATFRLIPNQEVPEPGSIALWTLAGLGGAAWWKRRRKGGKL